MGIHEWRSFQILLKRFPGTLRIHPGSAPVRVAFPCEKKTVRRKAGREPKLAAITNDFHNVRMQQRFAADEGDAHRSQAANLTDPKLQIVELRMRPRIIVTRAIGTIEIASVGEIKAALKRFAVKKTLARFKQVITGKFAADWSSTFM